MKITIINGPNLNLLEYRNSQIYGSKSLCELNNELKETFQNINFTFKQTNDEGKIINYVQDIIINNTADALIINPAGYSHTSIAIRDALEMIKIPKVEVHLSDYTKREKFRNFSLIKSVVNKTFYGEGSTSYHKAVKYILEETNE